jgi:hypothetical protein
MRLLFAQCRTIRQGRRLLHFKRRSRRLRTPAGAGSLKRYGRRSTARRNRDPRTRSRARPFRPRCARLVEVRNSPTFSPLLLTRCREFVPRCGQNYKKRILEHIRHQKARVPEERPSLAQRALGGQKTTKSRRDGPPAHAALSHQNPLIVFANEFFDALPVEILSPRQTPHRSRK